MSGGHWTVGATLTNPSHCTLSLADVESTTVTNIVNGPPTPGVPNRNPSDCNATPDGSPGSAE